MSKIGIFAEKFIMIKVTDFTDEINLKDCGVYLITHKNTNIKYIGSTTSVEGFNGRWRAHLNGFPRNVGNRVLLNIYKKYGIEGFKFHILERIQNKSIIRDRERYWIEYYDTYKHGANCSLETGCAFRNYDHLPLTEEQKEKYVNSSKTCKHTYVYDKNGNIAFEFISSGRCDKFFGLKKGRTNWAINHPIMSIPYQGQRYYPSYELKNWNPSELINQKRKETAKKIVITRKNKGSYNISNEHKNKIRQNNSIKKAVAIYDLEGNFVKQFISLNECDDYLKLTRGDTSKVLKGKAKTLCRKYIPKLI